MALQPNITLAFQRIKTEFNKWTNKLGVANGIATLGADGILNPAQRPPSGSITPLAYRSPANAGNIVTEYNALIADMVVKGMMIAPPMFAVSGQITGTGNDNVALSLVGTVTYNTTTDASGNFSFPAVLNDTYTLTPTKAGYYFTPGNKSVVVAGANMTAQDFAIGVGSALAETSLTHVLVQSSGGVRMFSKATRVFDAATFAAVAAASYGVCDNNGRWFIPVYSTNAIHVFDNAGVLKYSINTSTAFGVANPYRVFVHGSKMSVVGASQVRFFTYNNANEGTNPVTASGAGAIALTVTLLDAVADSAGIYVASSFGGTPNRNLTTLDAASEGVATFNQSQFSSNLISNIAVWGNTLLIMQGSQAYRINKTTKAQIGSVISLAGQPIGRIAASGGKFWLAKSNNTIDAIDAASGVVTNIPAAALSPNPSGFHGCVADDNFVYVADNSGSRIYVIDSATIAQSGLAVSSVLGSPAYLKN